MSGKLCGADQLPSSEWIDEIEDLQRKGRSASYSPPSGVVVNLSKLSHLKVVRIEDHRPAAEVQHMKEVSRILKELEYQGEDLNELEINQATYRSRDHDIAVTLIAWSDVA